ncbi:MAG: serine/threonine-protein kinase [Myxococcota bacterium]
MTLPDALAPGTRLARHYVLGERIGDGGMARVYRAEHEPSGRPVAIKILSIRAERSPEVAERFVQEAQLASRVAHEHVVEILELGQTDDGRPLIVMELLEGEELGVTLAREAPLTGERTRALLVQLLGAVQAVHDQGIIHRDIKPDNLFRIPRSGGGETLKIFDFGIAKIHEDDPGAKPLTLIGQVLGTPEYMSPEQGLGSDIDIRSDLYSVGILGYEMLTGVPPFRSDWPAKILVYHRKEPVPAMQDVAPGVVVEPELEAVIARALAKQAKDRFESAQQFAQALVAVGA